MSTEELVSAAPVVSTFEPCAVCGAPLAADQRYCLECGERRATISSFLRSGGPVPAGDPAGSTPPTPPSPPGYTSGGGAGGGSRSSTLTILAGIGVLLLAMGVGVLIGRSGSSKSSAPAQAQVISVASTPAASSGGEASSASFTSDWPSGTSGYTVQLRTLPESGTQVSAVEAAKTAATAKGASAVGALKSEEFSSLTAGNYVIYSGVYHKRAEAEKALAGLKKSFPAASVIHVAKSSSGSSAGGGSGSSSSSSGGASAHGAGSSEKNPAPPTVVQNLNKKKGQSYEQESKNLPNVISTG